MPLSEIQHKVEVYLRQSQALADYWQKPITPEQLQAEMNRMARDTKQPETLREIYQALNNDPLLIAECLARPALVDRLIRDAYSSDDRFHREVKQRAESDLRANPTVDALQQAGRNYSEKEGSIRRKKKGNKDNRTRRAGTESVKPGAGARLELHEDAQSYYVTTVLPIDEDRWKVRRITWSKEPFESWWSRVEKQIAMADPTTDYDYSLTAIAPQSLNVPNAVQAPVSSPPSARTRHTAIWTGSEMIIWGGYSDDGNDENTGGRYTPATDTWTSTSTSGAPVGRDRHTAIWSGTEMIVWGGTDNIGNGMNSGGKYNPATDSWIATSSSGAPSSRNAHSAIWTGTEMIVWGGFETTVGNVNTGGRYNPSSDTWTSTNTAGAPTARTDHTAIWTGTEMIVWGGNSNTGGRYNPGTNSWTSTTTTGAPQDRGFHSAVWSSNEMIVWGGYSFSGGPVNINTGGRYNPTTNTWSPTSTSGAPDGRVKHTAVWTGSEMIVWGGTQFFAGGITGFNTGGRYNPSSNTWIATSTISAPAERSFHSAIWTGSQMIVWGGENFYDSDNGFFNSGGKYAPASNTWLPTSTARVANGPAIVFASSRFGDPKVYLMNLDGTNQTRLTNDTTYDDQPRWSPDGSKIVFMSKRDGNFEIYSMNADGSSQTRLTNNPAADGFPAWSPDGTRIAFVSGDLSNPSTFEIYVMNADGSNRTRLTSDVLIDGVPAWSPDSTRIVFMSGATGLMDLNSFEIYSINADGSNRIRLTNNTLVDGQPTYSPDGARILFGSGEMLNPDGIELFVMNADGTNRTRLTNNAVTDGFAGWSPDGTKIIFASGSVGDESTVDLFVMNADGSNVTRLTNNQALDWFADWQPGAVFRISGQVNDGSGAPLGGITVTLGGSANATTTTSTGGAYSFPNLLPGGNYTVTPSSATFSFSPTNETFNGLNVNRIANFVATQSIVSLAGKIIDVSNAGINNVTVGLVKNGAPAGTVQTNAQGDYSFGNLAVGANYVVTPVGSFTPSSQTFGNLNTNATANFKAAPSIPSQCAAVSFGAATNFGTGNSPLSVAVADFNSDGRLDLAVAILSTNNVSVLLGNGAGSFSVATNFSVGSGPIWVVAGDFNGDGKLDLAAANQNSNDVSVLLGNGAGSFAAATNFGVGSTPRSVTVGDFNGDGKLDLAVANANSNSVSLLMGNGSGGFVGATSFPVGSAPLSVATGDFNRDGKLDVVIANSGSNNVSVLLGDGTGVLGAATNFAAASGPVSVVVGDFNGDARLDLAVANRDSNNVSVLFGNGAASFGAPTNFVVGTTPLSVAAGDFNGDEKSDLTVANLNSNNVSVLLGDGAGGFAAASNFAVGSPPAPQSVVVGDVNSDGKTDLVVAKNQFNVSVLLNNGTTCNTQTSLSISGQVKAANDTPLAGVTVTLSGPITRVTSTDSNGNYAFPNLAPGGNYSVTVQSNYFLIAPSRVDFFNLSSSQTANFIAAPVGVPLPTLPLSDDFNSPNRDTSKWTIGTQTQPVGSFDPQVTTAQINGQLVITPLTQASGMHYDGYVTANSFDLRNGKLSVELVKAATGGADTIFAIGSDSDNFYRFLVHTAGGPTSLAPTAKGRDGRERPLDTTVAQLIFQVKINGQLTSLSINYDSVQHRFMRFRHEPPMNSIVFETSANDIDYTVQNRVVLEKGVSALTAELSAGTSSPTNPGQAVFDNFGLVTSTFQFSSPSYSKSEGGGSTNITVTRTGDIAAAAAVSFRSENNSYVPCDTVRGIAVQNCDFILSSGILNFAPGQTSRSFPLIIVDDVYAEGNETLTLILSDASVSGLNSPGRAVLTIIDNDTAQPAANPLDAAQLFVRQHYYDFLGRLPDDGGLDYWTNEITQCGTNQTCINNKRVDVSNAFFYEQEYQQTASYVFLLYRAAYGNDQPFPNPDFFDANLSAALRGEAKKLPRYLSFVRDRAQVVGGTALAQTQLTLANAFVQRAELTTRYPSSLSTGAQFVDAVLAIIQAADGATFAAADRTALITHFSNGGRGLVMFHLANDYWNGCNRLPGSPSSPCVPAGFGAAVDNRVFIDAEYNRSFVYSQYSGYLRRDGDIGGFVFWLNEVSKSPPRNVERQHAMVCSFLTSTEFQRRLSPLATHSNAECPPP